MGMLGFLKNETNSREADLREARVGLAQSAIKPVFSVIDLETTGFSPTRDRIVEIGIVRLSATGDIVDQWHSRLNPERPMGASDVHGIQDADVQDAPVFLSIASTVSALLNETQIIAHNASFDMNFLAHEFEYAGWDIPAISPFCTLQWSVQEFPELPRHNLESCCAYLGIENPQAHSALYDALTASQLFLTPFKAGAFSGYNFESPSWATGPTRDAVAHPALKYATISQRITKSKKKPHELLLEQVRKLSGQSILPLGTAAYSEKLSYLTLLLEALDDGIITAEESESLAELARGIGLEDLAIGEIHDSLLRAICRIALEDGKVSAAEKSELKSVAASLGLTEPIVKRVLKEVEAVRFTELSVGLTPLPTNWSHGEPLRVGDKVVFTGGDDDVRASLEASSVSSGVLVMSGLSRAVVVLVSDGDFEGLKLQKARDLGTRIVSFEDYSHLLQHIQPIEL